MSSGPKRFIILFQGRSGSTYLTEALDSHPQVRCEVERMVPLRKHGSAAQLEWVKEFFRSSHQAAAAIGFKTKVEDIVEPAAFGDLLRQLRVDLILLSRRNVVKMVVSWFNCEQLFASTGRWNLYPPAKTLGPLQLDVEKFNRRLGLVVQGRSRLAEFVDRLQLRQLTLCYEDLLLEPRLALAQTCAWLGVPALNLSSHCLKATYDDLRKAILNFDELYEKYIGTEFQAMLDEVLIDTNGARN
jgi:LPS sulfotransferase NodH